MSKVLLSLAAIMTLMVAMGCNGVKNNAIKHNASDSVGKNMNNSKPKKQEITCGSSDGISGLYMGQVGDSDCEMLIYGGEGEYTMKDDGSKFKLKRVKEGVYNAYQGDKFVGSFDGGFDNIGYSGHFVHVDGTKMEFSLRLEAVF